MGLLDMFKPHQDDIATTRSALEQARDPERDSGGAVGELVSTLLSVGIDGKGPMKSARALANKTLEDKHDPEKAIDELVKDATLTGAVGGFVTSVGGFITMPIAIPANVLEFYLQATRLTAAIAHLRGYSLEDADVRTAVLLSLVDSNADEILHKVGLGSVAGGTVVSLARKNLPKSALMLINKAVGFQLLKTVGVKTFSKLGRAIPVLGGGIGAAMDAVMMRRIAENARREFPRINAASGLNV